MGTTLLSLIFSTVKLHRHPFQMMSITFILSLTGVGCRSLLIRYTCFHYAWKLTVLFVALSLVRIVLMEMYCLKIKIPHPRYPSTRVSVQVPNLGVHFSPERHCRIMDLLAILQSTTKSSDLGASEVPQTGSVSWHPADLATDARILVWRVCFFFFLIF